jgi:hypothetical protein
MSASRMPRMLVFNLTPMGCLQPNSVLMNRFQATRSLR